MTNIVFLVFACVLMGVGSYTLKTQVSTLSGQDIPTGIFALGVFIMFLFFMGCFGAWRESRLALGIYFIILFLLTVMLLAIGIGVSAKKTEAGVYLSEGWQSQYSSTSILINIQNYYPCCGLNYFNDSSAIWPCPYCVSNNSSDILAQPNAACGCVPQPAQINGRPNPNFPYNRNDGGMSLGGCLPLMVTTFNNAYSTLAAVGITFAVFMLIGMIGVCCLLRGIKAKAEKEENLHSGEDSSAPPETA